MIYVKPLPEGAEETLKEMQEKHPKSRTRKRAHMILLSASGYKRNEIAAIYKVKPDTVSGCFKRWEEEGLVGLVDKPREGRPRILTKEEEERAVKLLEEDPRNSKKAQSRLQIEIGKEMSEWTFKRTLKRTGLRWKRMRKSLKQRQDAEKAQEGKKK